MINVGGMRGVIKKMEAREYTIRIQMIADEYGLEKQLRRCVEELSELIKAICKWDRKWGDSLLSDSHECEERTSIIEEIADCKIMLSQIEYLMSAEYEVEQEVERKLDRQIRRIENGECDG